MNKDCKASVKEAVYIPRMEDSTPDFGAWRHRWAALKRKLNNLRTQSLSQLEELFNELIPTHLLSQADEGVNSR